MVDLVKYSGYWHEIFKIPFVWEQGCVDTRAEYQVIGKSKLSVKNTCILSTGQEYSRTGIAKVVPDNILSLKNDKVMQKLTIEFTDGLPSSGIGNYWIHWTDYEYSIVGGPGTNFLWLLGRSLEITTQDLESFKEYVSDLGYDFSQVVMQDNVMII